jgi:hypothetical protein
MTQDHAKDQAQAQAETIIELVAACNLDFDRMEELREERIDLVSSTEDPESEDETTAALLALAKWDEENSAELNELEQAAGDCKSQEEAREAIQENALSVEVRSGWHVPGEDNSPSEFRIVLCTGGPHVEIVGELDEYHQPCRAWIQYQDWGTPMTQYFDISQSTLIEYCSNFYFGE